METLLKLEIKDTLDNNDIKKLELIYKHYPHELESYLKGDK